MNSGTRTFGTLVKGNDAKVNPSFSLYKGYTISKTEVDIYTWCFFALILT